MADRLKGKVALVFGAGSIGPGWGNGKATAVAYAREGAKVVAVDLQCRCRRRRPRDIIRAEGGDLRGARRRRDRPASVSGGRAAAACRRSAASTSCTTTSAWPIVGGPVEMSEKVWADSMQLNIGSLFLTCKHVLPIMEAQGSRRDHQRLVDRQHPLARHRLHLLCGLQGGGQPVHPGDRAAVRAQGHPRQRDPAGHDEHADRAGGADVASSTTKPTWSRSATPPARPARWVMPGTSPGPRSSSPRTRRSTSPACCCRSTAA